MMKEIECDGCKQVWMKPLIERKWVHDHIEELCPHCLAGMNEDEYGDWGYIDD